MPRLISRSIALLAFLAFSAGALAATSLPPRKSDQAGVTVQVTPRGLTGPQWEFDITFNTHSQDLKDDPLKSVTLIVDGAAPLAPIAWKGDGPGSHHRKGVVRFKAPAASPATLELRLQRPEEPAPRVFRWQLR